MTDEDISQAQEDIIMTKLPNVAVTPQAKISQSALIADTDYTYLEAQKKKNQRKKKSSISKANRSKSNVIKNINNIVKTNLKSVRKFM
jgi:hypothetical protein